MATFAMGSPIYLYSLRKDTRKYDVLSCDVMGDRSLYLNPIYLSPLLTPFDLGDADSKHSRNLVELLICLQFTMDEARLCEVLQACIFDSFPCLGGSRCEIEAGRTICPGKGVRFSYIKVDSMEMLSKPLSPDLFDPPVQNELFTVRLTNFLCEDSCAIGICFDHSLCDMGGLAIFLSHLSARYISDTLPVQPHHDRTCQRVLFPDSEVSPLCSPQMRDDKGKVLRGPSAGVGPRKQYAGGVVCVEWTYNAVELQVLKEESQAITRHEAIFADVICLLSSAGADPLRSCSLSRNERGRTDIPHEHFGNATSIISFPLPSMKPLSAGAVVRAIRSAVSAASCGTGQRTGDTDHGGAAVHSDVHLNTWWHALQRPLFGCTAASFGIGPRTLSSAARLCAHRLQPNVTVLPAPDDAVRVYLLAPLHLAHAVRTLLHDRHRSRVRGVDDGGTNRKPTRSEQDPITSLLPTVPDLPSNQLITEFVGGYRDSSSDDRKGPAAGVSVDVMSVPTPIPVPPVVSSVVPATAVIIWLHGLGGTAAVTWKERLGNPCDAQWHFPTAPTRPVTALGGEVCNAWFDVVTWQPISEREPEEPAGLQESVAAVHAVVANVVSSGVSSRRVVLGGISQGGAVAVAAALSCPHPLGGAVSISGWCPVRCSLHRHIHPANARLPIHFSYGSADPVVDSRLCEASCRALLDAACNVAVRVERRTKHWSNKTELKIASDFIVRRLCNNNLSSQSL